MAATQVASDIGTPATATETALPDDAATAYPPPHPTTLPTATLDTRAWQFKDDRESELIRALQTELESGDAAALALRVDGGDIGHLEVLPAGMIEGGAYLPAEDVKRLLDDAFAAGSTPHIDGFHRATFEGMRSLCLGVVTRGWQVGVMLPTPDTTESNYGQRMPDSIPPAWWGWQFCHDGANDWSWRHWLWFEKSDRSTSDAEMRIRLRAWLDHARWSSGDEPATWDSWPTMPTYYVMSQEAMSQEAPGR